MAHVPLPRRPGCSSDHQLPQRARHDAHRDGDRRGDSPRRHGRAAVDGRRWRRSTRRITAISRRARPSTRRTRWSSCSRSRTPTPSATPSSFPGAHDGRHRAWRSAAASNTAAPVNGYVDWLATDGRPAGRRHDAAGELVLPARLARSLSTICRHQADHRDVTTVRSAFGERADSEVHGGGAEGVAVLGDHDDHDCTRNPAFR